MISIQLSELGAILFRLALDPDTPDGTWQARAIDFFELARGARASLLIEQDDNGKLAAMSTEIKFGQYAGKTIWWLVANKPRYVRWLLSGDCKYRLNDEIREEIDAELKRHLGNARREDIHER
jgi:hypothetical protein